MLRERSIQYPIRCKSCQSLRSTLRSLVSRQSNESASNTSASSHTRYQDLTSAEKDERLKNLHCTLKVSNQKVKQLQAKVDKLIAKVDKLIAKQSVCLQVSPVVEDRFPLNSPQHIFWDQQRRYNTLRDKCQMRWHPLVIRFALNLKYLSGTAYQAVHKR